METNDDMSHVDVPVDNIVLQTDSCVFLRREAERFERDLGLVWSWRHHLLPSCFSLKSFSQSSSSLGKVLSIADAACTNWICQQLLLSFLASLYQSSSEGSSGVDCRGENTTAEGEGSGKRKPLWNKVGIKVPTGQAEGQLSDPVYRNEDQPSFGGQ